MSSQEKSILGGSHWDSVLGGMNCLYQVLLITKGNKCLTLENWKIQDKNLKVAKKKLTNEGFVLFLTEEKQI